MNITTIFGSNKPQPLMLNVYEFRVSLFYLGIMSVLGCKEYASLKNSGSHASLPRFFPDFSLTLIIYL